MQGVLTLAGEGTRMLPWTRGLRKEFLPLYDLGMAGSPVLKPVAHLALEALASAGADEITLVVGTRDLVTAQNYFTIDRRFLTRHAHHKERLTDTERFYHHLETLRLRFAVQDRPAGFGDAVLRSESFVAHEPFLLHAADAVIIERERGGTLRRMAGLREHEGLDAVLLVRKVADPTRYGVIEGHPAGDWAGLRRIDVTGMEEKPTKPKSHWAATAVYALAPSVFAALHAEARRRPKELELTAALARVLKEGGNVAALVLSPVAGTWRSVGSAEGYFRSLQATHRDARRRNGTTSPKS